MILGVREEKDAAAEIVRRNTFPEKPDAVSVPVFHRIADRGVHGSSLDRAGLYETVRLKP
jgi:hypothetical protein